MMRGRRRRTFHFASNLRSIPRRWVGYSTFHRVVTGQAGSVLPYNMYTAEVTAVLWYVENKLFSRYTCCLTWWISAGEVFH